MLADEPVAIAGPGDLALGDEVPGADQQGRRHHGALQPALPVAGAPLRDPGYRFRNDGEGGEIVFDGPALEIDERKFREIYGEDAVEVEIGPGDGKVAPDRTLAPL